MTVTVLLVLALIAVLAFVAGLYIRNIRSAIRREGAEVTYSWDLLLRGLQDRAETLPKLVEDVRHTTDFEKDIFEEVLAAAKQLAAAKSTGEVCEAISAGKRATADLYRIAEYYPKLEAEPAWLALKAEAAEAEIRIERERGIYDRTVREFNRLITTSFAGRRYAQQINLLACDTVDKHDESAHPGTSPVQLASAL